ncbi:MAG: dTMP kinase [Parcubacteria group bacterium]|nr:dTMP kinase [Parcubacteria group bacterium]
MATKGKFIVIDGLDGCGKGTQMKMLEEKLAMLGNVIFTREPGGTPYAEEIRSLILGDLAKDLSALTQFFLFLAARNDHMEKRVIPALCAGTHVISDRGDSSTWAFQIYGGESMSLRERFLETRKWVLGEHEPDLYIVLDLKPEIAFERTRNDTSREKTHFDNQLIEYHARVRAGFLEFSKFFPVRIVEASRSKEEIHADIFAAVLAVLRK